MKIKSVSYGRTVALGDNESFKTEKIWFGWEVELEEHEDAGYALEALRAKADAQEQKERDDYAQRNFDRRMKRR